MLQSQAIIFVDSTVCNEKLLNVNHLAFWRRLQCTLHVCIWPEVNPLQFVSQNKGWLDCDMNEWSGIGSNSAEKINHIKWHKDFSVLEGGLILAILNVRIAIYDVENISGLRSCLQPFSWSLMNVCKRLACTSADNKFPN